MRIETPRSDVLTLDAEVVEGLMTGPEAPVSDAPLPTVESEGELGLLLLLGISPKPPKEPRRK